MSEYLSQKSVKTEATSPRKRTIGHLVPATGGFGLQPKIDPEEQRLIEEENLNYSSHSKRARTYEQNFEYVEANRKSENQIVSKLNQVNLAKTEPELPDSTLIDYYNTPSFNFFNHKYNSNLPILQHREEIVQNLQEYNIMIIQGNTGCGKTTQVPQFIIDDAAQSSRRCKMLITQPRRIAAKSISKRVCDERGWKWGSVCGYKVSLENKFSEETRIFYVTTGYLLEMIVANHAELQNYTHIILDEIHDRDLDTDLVILLIKLLLMKQFTGKVVMMSATLDPEIFIQYFSPYAIKNHIPVIQCQINVFDVVTKHLDDIEDMVNLQSEPNSEK
ncbi:ATP-dependent RNA helicase TDRD9 [Brachionus plicatilis]|uniref:ATP-dependent RNA helicase TDRD9 n=1 Tax=Brachionus plicatilis TaxID=10195 RepID=A0A3M7Q422_BRAPC|nr:ATP-dependent RNA helicase TDRD9 [Brachionus plicatilis]